MSKRVVFLADSISTQKAGIHQYGLQLIDSIIERFPDNEYFSISSTRIPNSNLSQHLIPITKAIPFHLRWRQLISIPKKASELKPDVVIELAHFGPFNLPKHIRRITVIHDLSAVTHKQYHNTASHIVQRFSLPHILKQTNTIITNSYYTKQEIINTYNIVESKIQVLYPSVLPSINLQNTVSDFPFIGKQYFLCVGTIEPRKNYESVIKAFEQVHKKNPQFHLVIVGMSGWKNDSLFKLYDRSISKENIHLTGFASESQLAQIYENAFTFISASHFEGFGIPILEAADRTLPLIIADNSSQKEIVTDNALLFSSGDFNQLKNKMEMLIHSSELREDLIKKSVEIVSNIEQKRKKQLNQLKL